MVLNSIIKVARLLGKVDVFTRIEKTTRDNHIYIFQEQLFLLTFSLNIKLNLNTKIEFLVKF